MSDRRGTTLLQRGLRWFLLILFGVRLVGALVLMRDFPEASRHLWFGCARVAIFYFIAPRLHVDVVTLFIGADVTYTSATLFEMFGWQAGFQYFALCLVFIVFLFEHLSLSLRMFMAVLPVVGMIFYAESQFDVLPFYQLTNRQALTFSLVNLSLSVLMSAVILIYFIGGLQRSREQTQKLAIERGHLITDLSHEMKTPLAAMMTRVQVGRDRERDPAQDSRLLEILERNLRGMSRLVRRMLDYTRLEAGASSEPALQSIDPIAIARDCLEWHEPTAKAKSVRLEVVDEFQDQVMSDPDLLGVILQNLIGNAVRHTPENSVVTIACKRVKGRCRLTIRDEGPGIDEKAVPRLFEPFFRGDRSRSRGRGEGEHAHGLGLSIVQRAAAKLDAEIEVDPGLGRGACFMLWLDCVTS